ncbi:hypothetical protein [Limosilactobacillus viscerum]|uniref:hypothetical protein n=1 Tax=Limosilactobacillus viscerum TaxID=2993450 RepID=UPI0024B9832C|nr:hypothetical protein [Limosilactobacillus viscerum]
MQEIPIKQAKSILKRALKGKVNQKIVLFTKKKDRLLTVETCESNLVITEQGYVDATNTYQLSKGEAKHELTAAFKREFPRSHQLYINQVKE